jgi:EmrB/QacA subfamily drug resistance transporter
MLLYLSILLATPPTVTGRGRPTNGGDVGAQLVRRWWALSVLCLALLVVSLQTSILNVALPSLVADLGASDSQLQWIVDAYTVAFAGLLLTGAALADRYGRLGVMSVGLGLCGASSVGAMLSTDPTGLVLWRTAMGVGAGLVMPATLSILVNVFTDRRERSRAIAYWSLMNATGAFVGPIAGGLLLRWSSWHACFAITLPLVAIALAAGPLVVPTSRDPSAARFDLVGAVLSAAALATVVWGVIEGPGRGWTDPVVAGAFMVAVLAAVAFVRWELRTAHPMIDIDTFRNPQLSAASLALVIAFLAMTAAMYLTTLSLQLAKGYTALAAAVATSLPITAVNFLVVPQAPRLIARFGTRWMICAGTAVIAASSLVIATISPDSGYLPLLVGFALMALAFSIFVPASTEAIMTAVPPERSGGVSAVSQLSRQVGQALGVAVGGGVATIGYRHHFDGSLLGLDADDLHSARSSITGALDVASTLSGSARDALVAVAQSSYLSGVRIMLYVAAAAALVGSAYAALAIPAREVGAEDGEAS